MAHSIPKKPEAHVQAAERPVGPRPPELMTIQEAAAYVRSQRANRA